VEELAAALLASGVDVERYSPGDPWSPGAARGVAGGVARELSQLGEPPDLVHGFHPLPLLAALLFFPTAAGVLSGHGPSATPAGELHPRVRRYLTLEGPRELDGQRSPTFHVERQVALYREVLAEHGAEPVRAAEDLRAAARELERLAVAEGAAMAASSSVPPGAERLERRWREQLRQLGEALRREEGLRGQVLELRRQRNELERELETLHATTAFHLRRLLLRHSGLRSVYRVARRLLRLRPPS
jgi:hypothetical protein